MKVIRVNASKSYDVVIGKGLMPETGIRVRDILPNVGKIMLVSDDNVYPIYGDTVAKSLEKSGFSVSTFVLSHGENSKTLENYGRLLEKMCLENLSRSDAVVALGGGVVGDLAGFAAATYQRGLHLIQMPTSLLAAVDSSVGGKTAVNLPSGKNQVGSFYQPELVLCDINALETLPEGEYKNGCAEIIKYAVLDGDEMFSEITRTPIKEQYEEIIGRCVSIKKNLVEADEKDTGSRMLLNLGHTIGHAIEGCSCYSIPHGQAVAMGLAAITRAGEEKGYSEKGLAQALANVMFYYDLDCDLPYSAEEMAEVAAHDKKNTSDEVRLIVPARPGKCEIVNVQKNSLVDWLKAGGAE